MKSTQVSAQWELGLFSLDISSLSVKVTSHLDLAPRLRVRRAGFRGEVFYDVL